MHFAAKLVALGGLASTAAAHGIVNAFVTDGKWQRSFWTADVTKDDAPETAGWTAKNQDLGFVSVADYKTPDIICHKGATNAKKTASVSAGGTVEFQWSEWPTTHVGPVITYVANCGGDCTTVDKEELKFVKIEEEGYDKAKGKFASVIMAEEHNSTWTTTVPESLAAGHYVFRHEIIGLYGKQHYPQCINIEVTGDGTEEPEGVLGVEIYDEEFDTNPTGGDEGYRIPGPELWVPGSIPAQNPGASGSASGTGAAPTSSAAASTDASSAAPTTTGAAEDARYPGASATPISASGVASADPTGLPTTLSVVPSAAPTGLPADPSAIPSGFPALPSDAPCPSGLPSDGPSDGPSSGFGRRRHSKDIQM